jgi:hypothetical protein
MRHFFQPNPLLWFLRTNDRCKEFYPTTSNHLKRHVISHFSNWGGKKFTEKMPLMPLKNIPHHETKMSEIFIRCFVRQLAPVAHNFDQQQTVCAILHLEGEKLHISSIRFNLIPILF